MGSEAERLLDRMSNPVGQNDIEEKSAHRLGAERPVSAIPRQFVRHLAEKRLDKPRGVEFDEQAAYVVASLTPGRVAHHRPRKEH